MKLITFNLSSKRLFAAFLALLVAFLILLDFLSCNTDTTLKVTDNAGRVEFIRSLGVEPSEQAVSIKETVIPTCLNDVYLTYNALQKSAGYNLLELLGETVTVYCYEIPDLNGKTAYVNLLIHENKVVGGDISSAELSGFMLPLKKIEE